MGAGASSLMRLRKALLLRTYNVKAAHQTIEEKFREFAVKNGSPDSSNSGKLILKVSGIHEALELDKCSWLSDMVTVFIGNQVTELDFREFVDFLEAGKPMSYSNSLLPEPQKSGDNRSCSNSSSNNNNNNSNDSNNNRKKNNSISSVGSSGTSRESSPTLSLDATGGEASQRGRSPPSPPSSAGGVVGGVKVVSFEHGYPKETSTSLIKRAGSTIDSPLKKYETIMKPSQPIWQKREIVKHERTVTYITIDEDGERQELFESEIQQTEILHMESRITGEFAHRETTHYESSELFNKEVVSQQDGTEEYVHMKSLEDEYEFLESNLPKKAGKEPPQHKESDEGHEREEEHLGAGPSPFSPIVNDDYNFTEARTRRQYSGEGEGEEGEREDEGEHEGYPGGGDNGDMDHNRSHDRRGGGRRRGEEGGDSKEDDHDIPAFDARKLNQHGDWRVPPSHHHNSSGNDIDDADYIGNDIDSGRRTHDGRGGLEEEEVVDEFECNDNNNDNSGRCRNNENNNNYNRLHATTATTSINNNNIDSNNIDDLEGSKEFEAVFSNFTHEEKKSFLFGKEPGRKGNSSSSSYPSAPPTLDGSSNLEQAPSAISVEMRQEEASSSSSSSSSLLSGIRGGEGEGREKEVEPTLSPSPSPSPSPILSAQQRANIRKAERERERQLNGEDASAPREFNPNDVSID